MIKDPQLTSFFLHNNNQVIRKLTDNPKPGLHCMQNNCFDYPAQFYFIFNAKISIPKKLKDKTLSTSVPKHPGPHLKK